MHGVPGPRIAAAVVGTALLVAAAGCGDASSGATTPPTGPASASSSETPMTGPASFLSGYVTSDGRVLRHDQGDDVVSEGQAYGMLAAELAGRDDVARTIWTWTKQHLQRPDDLLAFHADSEGHVLDQQAATDADALAAYALLRFQGTDADALHADGRAIASAVLAHETVTGDDGRPILVAGPWAAEPVVVNPSYLMPSVFTDLATMTGDTRWRDLATSSVDLVDQVTQQGDQLPPDWARLDGGRLVPTGSGGSGGPPQYGPDAQRVPLWFGSGCDAQARRLAAGWWYLLQQDDRSSAGVLTVNGDVVDPGASAVALLASGASARAAGDTEGAAQLETGARQTDAGRSTYYGGAWLVLAAALRDGRLTSCP
jgi:endo-1,4-beta-D-glucanase Y